MLLLNSQQIEQKIKRLAIEILERNCYESGIVLAGINNNGTAFCEKLYARLSKITDISVQKTTIHLSPANPLERPITIDMPDDELQGKVIIVVDDVANTGRTLFYAMQPLFGIIAKKIEVAVLVDRKHKSFPIRVDYMGLTLATTLKENIDVQIMDVEEEAVYLA